MTSLTRGHGSIASLTTPLGQTKDVNLTEIEGTFPALYALASGTRVGLPRGHRLGIDGTGGTKAVRLRSADLGADILPEQRIIDLIGLFGLKPRPPAML